jgi:hypothetical protein
MRESGDSPSGTQTVVPGSLGMKTASRAGNARRLHSGMCNHLTIGYMAPMFRNDPEGSFFACARAERRKECAREIPSSRGGKVCPTAR